MLRKQGMAVTPGEENEGIVFDIQHFSVHDGPGIRTNVFLKGCPLRCRWCSNPESQRLAPQVTFEARLCIGCGECERRCPLGTVMVGCGKASVDLSRCIACTDHPCLVGCHAKALELAGRKMAVDQVLERVLQDRAFYGKTGGVTFTGGEPFFQPGFLARLAAAAKENRLTTAVETCLSVPWEHIALSAGVIDTFLCDIKHVDATKLDEFTGGDWELIRANLTGIVDAGYEAVVRVPVIPGFNATEEEIEAITFFAVSIGIGELHLLPYHALGTPKYDKLNRVYSMSGSPVLGREEMMRLQVVAESSGLTVLLNG